MKNLYLMRHGKSSWELNVSDENRALLQRGITDAQLIGSELSRKGLAIDHVFSSPANRALHTATICLNALSFPIEKCSLASDLYDFSGEKVIRFIKNLSNEMNSVLIFGHNHAFTYIANQIGSRYIDNVPTSGFVHIQFEQDSWESITQGTTIQTIFPKQLKTW